MSIPSLFFTVCPVSETDVKYKPRQGLLVLNLENLRKKNNLYIPRKCPPKFFVRCFFSIYTCLQLYNRVVACKNLFSLIIQVWDAIFEFQYVETTSRRVWKSSVGSVLNPKDIQKLVVELPGGFLKIYWSSNRSQLKHVANMEVMCLLLLPLMVGSVL